MTTKKKVQTNDTPSFYKGYDIEWLRSVKEEHSDGYLVDEYDSLNVSEKGVEEDDNPKGDVEDEGDNE